MDPRFILKNHSGRIVARCIEYAPDLLEWLRRSESVMKSFIAMHLRGERIDHISTIDCDGFRMRLWLSDDIQRQIYLQMYETQEIALCRPLVQRGGVCIDVGANVGWFTLHFAEWVGATGRVLAFEADPRIAADLKENVEMNRMSDSVELMNAAIGDTVGTVPFTRSPATHSGWGSVLRQEGNRGGECITVPCTTLDALVESRGLFQVDLLKIDVEGSEFEVLNGACKSLARQLFRNVLIEWAGEAQTARGRSMLQMHEIFESNGYEPAGEAAMLIAEVQAGRVDARRLFANLMYCATTNCTDSRGTIT